VGVPSRRPGRPRSETSHRAILEATTGILADDGWSGLTIDRVVRRARVSKATIYRRWSSKEHMVVAALSHAAPPAKRPPVDGTRAELAALLASEIERIAGSPAGSALLALAPHMASRPTLAEHVRMGFAAPRTAALREVLRRAAARGELRADVDSDLVAEMLAGPVLVRVMAGDSTGAPETARRIVDTLVDGLERRAG
jgi:AcrR family transcriptional regulator